MSVPRRAHRFTHGRMTGRLGATCGLLLFAGALVGISECSATCTDSVTGEKYKCTRCESVDQNACTEDLWYVDGWGTECLEGDRPEADDGSVCANGHGMCQAGGCLAEFPCTEQGILDAIATGGGPHTFDCTGPTTVATQAEIVIDNDVILDGGGVMTIDPLLGNTRIFSVLAGVSAELRGMTLTGAYNDYDEPLPLITDGCAIRNDGVLTLQECEVVGNGCSLNAEPISSMGSLTLVNSAVRGNSGFPGAISGSVMLIGSEVSGNRGHPSAISGNVTLIDSVMDGNVQDRLSPGPYDGGPVVYGSVTAIRSTISNNVAGGDDSLWEGDAVVINSTVSGNSSSSFSHFSDGLFIGSTVVIEPCAHPSGFCALSGTWLNSILVIETSDYYSWSCTGAVSAGGNIESPGNTCGLFDQSTDQVNVTAEQLALGPLQDNGGPTMTHALGAGSVAIDQIPAEECVDAEGAPLTTDQRGFPRDSMCDVGAFEVQP